MIKKLFPIFFILCVIFVLFGIFAFLYTPFMYVPASTKITIGHMYEKEYNEMKSNIKDFITTLNKPLTFDCDFDQEYWKANRDKGELICQDYKYNELFMKLTEGNVSIVYNATASFGLPTEEKITEEHKMIQGLFIGLAYYFKEKYKKDVQVIFHHRDLPKEGRMLFK